MAKQKKQAHKYYKCLRAFSGPSVRFTDNQVYKLDPFTENLDEWIVAGLMIECDIDGAAINTPTVGKLEE